MERRVIVCSLLLLMALSAVFVSGCGKEEAGMVENESVKESVSDVVEYNGRTAALIRPAGS